MKKIYAVTLVKNESDIIESFIRYTLTYCDGIIIYNDDSLDDTAGIIRKLADEGLNIFLASDNERTSGLIYQADITTALIKRAIEHYGADLILPLDADEFLIPAPGLILNVKDKLLALPDDKACAYCAPWTHFIPTGFKRRNDFLPKYFKTYCDPAGERHFFNKVIIPAHLINGKTFYVSKGNHNLFVEEETAEKELVCELMLAHLPYRSAEQLITKTVTAAATVISMPKDERQKYANALVGYMILYEVIKSQGYLSETQIQQYTAKIYRYFDIDNPDVKLLNYVWDTNIELKYTDYEKSKNSMFNIILTHYEQIIEKLL